MSDSIIDAYLSREGLEKPVYDPNTGYYFYRGFFITDDLLGTVEVRRRPKWEFWAEDNSDIGGSALSLTGAVNKIDRLLDEDRA